MYNTVAELDAPDGPNRAAKTQAAITEISRPMAPAQRRPEPRQVSLRQVLSWLRRSLLLIIVAALALAAVGVAYSVFTKPRYTAHAELVIDPSNLQVVPDDIYAQSQQRDSQLLEVESMLGVLTSGNTLGRVIGSLDLSTDPEFVRPAGLDVAALLGISSSSTAAARPPEVIALEALDSRIKAVREDGSFLVSVNLWAEDPQKSVQVLNAVVTAFKDELAQEESEGAKRSVSGLSDQLTALKAAVTVAEDAVETFKRDHNLQQSNGELSSGQSMTQLNAQVTDAQARLIAAQSRYDALNKASATGASTEVLESATMTALRSQYATLKAQYDSQAATLGARHPTMLELGRQVKATADQVQAEINRNIAAAKSDVAAAQQALDALTRQTLEARNSVATDDQAQVRLRELQREADSAAAIYQAYLNRADQLAQRQQINTTNVRVISPPVLPIRSWPPGVLLAGSGGLVAGAFLGALLALGLGFLHDTRKPKAAPAK